MLTDVLVLIAAILSAMLVGFVARRILETPVGWPRSIIVGLIVFISGLPFANWLVDQTGLLDANGETEDARAAATAIAVVVLGLAWVFAIGVAALVALEAIFPTRRLPNPIHVVRAAIRQRKRSRRYLDILATASRHGVGWVFHGRPLPQRYLGTSTERAAAIVAAINDSGVTFVKLGQVISTRRDLVPEPYLTALASLQSSATTLPWDAIQPAIESEIGGPLDTVYRYVEPRPLAAASVAQVHRAVLKDGTKVVVKVQRPAARAQVEADTDIILRLAERAERHSRMGRDLGLEALAQGFTSTLRDELDYRIEATNTEMIRNTLALITKANHGEGIAVTVPVVYPQGSAGRVITMDLVDGVPLSRAGEQLAALTADERETLAMGLMATVIEQILVHGVFHADLHPGNVILRENGSLGLIDFGAVGIIESSQRQHLIALLLATASADDIAATDALLLIVDLPGDADLDAIRHDIGVVLTSERYRPAGSGSIFSRVVDVIRKHRLALPADLASAFRSFATLEGCLKVIDADFDMIARALPVIPRMLRRMLNARELALGAQAQAAVTIAMLRALPRRLNGVVTSLESGAAVAISEAGKTRASLRAFTSELVGTLVSIAATVLAVVLVVSDGGPMMAGGLRLFDLLGALIGLFGFLGLLRVVREMFVRRRS